MRRAPVCEVIHRVHVSDGGEVLVGVRPPVFGGIALAADGTPYEHLADPVTVTMGRERQGVGRHAYFHTIDVERLRVGRSRHESDIPKVQSINGSLERLDGLYGPASVLTDQGPVVGVVPPLLQVSDGRRRQSVNVLRGNQAGGDSPSGVLILDYQRPGFAGVFRAPKNAELREL